MSIQKAIQKTLIASILPIFVGCASTPSKNKTGLIITPTNRSDISGGEFVPLCEESLKDPKFECPKP